jgi:hypothetical protein
MQVLYKLTRERRTGLTVSRDVDSSPHRLHRLTQQTGSRKMYDQGLDTKMRLNPNFFIIRFLTFYKTRFLSL